jgi:hypothetical protein
MYAIEYIALSMNVNLETGSIITEQTQQLETLASEDITKATHRLLCEMDAEDHEIVPTYENTTYFLENFSQV